MLFRSDIKGEGTVGLITYLRTDSTRVSKEAEKAAKEFLRARYGASYLGAVTEEKKKGQKIQDAHEAIRPTDINRTPEAVKDQIPRDLYRLYQLIWKRFTASRMSPARYETTSVKIRAEKSIFTVAASSVLFDGFMKVYNIRDEKEEENTLTVGLNEESVL